MINLIDRVHHDWIHILSSTYREFHHQGIHDTADDCDKVESIPSIFEVTLEHQIKNRLPFKM